MPQDPFGLAFGSRTTHGHLWRAHLTTIITIPGAWHGDWVLRRFNTALRLRGFAVHALTMPSLGGVNRRGIPADAEAVRKAIDSIRGPVALVGHSYAGIVITEAGDHPSVNHLIYVAAFMPDVGESALSLIDSTVVRRSGETTLQPFIRRHSDPGLFDLDREPARTVLYSDCRMSDAADATARLRPHLAAVFHQSPRRAAWKIKRSTFVVCRKDRAIPPSLQREMASRATLTMELDSSHSPFLSMPETLAAKVARTLRAQ